jgi:hypothetical protein
MVCHVVLMKPRPDLPDADRRAFAAALARAVREIPAIRGIRIGRRVTHGARYEHEAPDTGEYLAIIEVGDLAGLQAYLAHPAHEALGALFRQSAGAAWVYDYEMGGLEMLGG